jgi:hypothetical protein
MRPPPFKVIFESTLRTCDPRILSINIQNLIIIIIIIIIVIIATIIIRTAIILIIIIVIAIIIHMLIIILAIWCVRGPGPFLYMF